jgi:hypothetical protein
MKAAPIALIAPFFLALALAATAAGPSLAQVINPDNLDRGAYSGVDRARFYNPRDRISVIRTRLEAARSSGNMSRPDVDRALHRLDAINRDLDFRIQRKGGELRDWDRELINDQLDDLVSAYPSIRS